MQNLYVSHSPVTNTIKVDGAKRAILGRWRKSVKTTKGIGGKIFANAFGDSKQEAEKNAAIIAALPELLEALQSVMNDLPFQPTQETYNKIELAINNCYSINLLLKK